MLLAGVSSDSFPEEAPKRVVELAEAAGLAGIEWQALSHCRIGDMDAADTVRSATEDAGLVTLAYGVDLPFGDAHGPKIDDVVQTAAATGTSLLRIRLGGRKAQHATDEELSRVIGTLTRCSEAAASLGLMVAVGLHPESHAATGRQATALIATSGAPNTDLFWMPNAADTIDEACEDLSAVKDNVVGLHCSGLDSVAQTTRLSELTDRWARYLSIVAEVDDDHWVVIRGVEAGDPPSFYRDAQTLRRLTKKYGPDE